MPPSDSPTSARSAAETQAATHSSDKLQPEPPAPVWDAPQKVRPEPVNVSDAIERAKLGVELTKLVLLIFAISVVGLLAYLWFLDHKTSSKVDDVYERIFSAINLSARPEAGQITEVIGAFRKLERDAPGSFSADDITMTTESIPHILYHLHISGAEAASLRRCAELAKAASPGPMPAASPLATSSKPALTPAASKILPSADSNHISTKIGNCIEILERHKAALGTSVDLEQLRLIRDFTKDIHDNHQSFRTFWISAAQLILVNVLLPLLTALLGYIFGRESSRE